MVNTTTQFDRDSDDNDIWAILYDQDKRNPSNRCITGQGVVDNLLNSGNLTRIHSQLCTVFVVDKSLGILKDPRGFNLLVRPGGPVPIIPEHPVYGCQFVLYIHMASIC
jgi:hypothetical protein